MTKQDSLPEAVASVTYTVISPGGFPALVTFREPTSAALFEKMFEVEAEFTAKDYKPQEARKFGGGGSMFPKKEITYVDGRVCPKCGEKLVWKIVEAFNKNTGQKEPKKLISCSTQKYDWKTKTKSGCDFTEWVNETTPTNPTNQSDSSTGPWDDLDQELHGDPASDGQKKFITDLITQGSLEFVDVNKLSKEEARRLLSAVKQ